MGVIARSDEWARLDVTEAHAESCGFKLSEFSGRVEARHGKVIARRAQVLADGEDVAVNGGEIAEDGKKFVCLFAQTDHDSGLGDA